MLQLLPLSIIRRRSALEADAEESIRMVDLEFISRRTLAGFCRWRCRAARACFSPAAQSQKSGHGFSVSAWRPRVDAYIGPDCVLRAAILEATNLCGSRRTIVLRSAAQPRVSSPAPSACCADRGAVQHEMLYVLAVRQYGISSNFFAFSHINSV